MPLLNVSVSDKITATITLERTTADTLDAYATYTKANADAVLDHALRYVFAKDKDFQLWLVDSPPASTKSLRVKATTTPAKSTNHIGVARKMRGSAHTSDANAVQ